MVKLGKIKLLPDNFTVTTVLVVLFSIAAAVLDIEIHGLPGVVLGVSVL